MPLLGGKNKFKTDPPKIRVETIAVEPKPKPKPKITQTPVKSSASPRPSNLNRLPINSISRQKSHSPYPSSSDERRADRKRKPATPKPAQRQSPTERIDFGKDSDNEDDSGWLDLEARKRQRKSPSDPELSDLSRKLKHPKAFQEKDPDLRLIHATHVASLELKCVPVMGASKEDVAIELQYPSLQRREKYVNTHPPNIALLDYVLAS